MEKTRPSGDTINKEQDRLAREIMDALHRTIVHYGLWFKEVETRLGIDECLRIEGSVWDRTRTIQMKRLGKILGFEVEDGIPAALRRRSPEELRELLEGLSVNWLANDGVWFQGVEQRHDLPTAQRCNDAAWGSFSPFEASCIKHAGRIPGDGPLDRLDAALRRRLYANINTYTIERPETNVLILRMVECRVQLARKRKGLEDYPCKSGGTIEYTTFATAIDPGIRTECLGCPPDAHPADWFCAWRFSLGG